MKKALAYGSTAKAFHWSIVALLVVQYLIGWFMPDIHRDMKPGGPMTLHISVGIAILALIALRLLWRITHPVAPEPSLPAWQKWSAESLHWLLYALVLVTAVTGWSFASFRGWAISLFFALPLPMLASEASPTAHAIGRLHVVLEWTLLIAIGLHVSAALVHRFIYRDRVLQRMLPT